MTIQTAITMTIEQGLDLILSHFLGVNTPKPKPGGALTFPRTISTKVTDGRQILVSSRKEALARFSQANYLDCRVSAYPPNVIENPSLTQRFVGIRTVTPANLIIMIDLDRCNFKTERGFNITLTTTLNNIKNKLNVVPTVLWSGRGYHIILPLTSNGIILENVKEFAGIPNISLKFLRYAELSLSSKKSDPQHNHTMSFNNCMLRIPGSINSKNGQTVRLIQKWDGSRPEINYLLAGFTRYIINEKYVELLKAQKRSRRDSKYLVVDNDNRINWVERLLQTPIQDHRKYCIWRILAPYLLNVRHLSYDESFNIIRDWLDRCNQLQRIDFNVNQRINEGLRGAERKGFLQISKDKLEEENGELHYLLQNIRTGGDVNFKMDWE
jgi:hypothetical protein